MMLSALRNSDPNMFGQFKGTKSDTATGIAWPGNMQKWLREIAGFDHVGDYTSYVSGDIKNTTKVTGFLHKNPNDVVVLMLVRAGGLQNSSKKIDKKSATKAGTKKSDKEQGEFLPNHWVRLLAPNVPLWPMWLNWIFRGSRVVWP